ncbi:MAG TPA: cupin domain-containing protein [Bryobacteraceae bacterium]|jgi:mannose-6-phosphate isomerase-like protein (cupin superfamily)
MIRASKPEVLDPVVVGPNEDRATHPIHLHGRQVAVKATGRDTGGSFAAGLLRAEPMSGPPLHLRTQEDEWFYILKGELAFEVGDRCFIAVPGTAVFAPRDVPHTWQNFTGEMAEALEIVTPAAMLETSMTRQGIITLGPPLSR